jgi:UDP-N-acetylglucosamine 2-epimerase (non-hydrolysing)
VGDLEGPVAVPDEVVHEREQAGEQPRDTVGHADDVQQEGEAPHLHAVTQHADDHVPAGLAPRRRVSEHRAEAIIARSVQAPLTVLSVVGTRPNFMKIAPVVAALAERGDAWRHVLVHTGQHYDDAMSRIFLEELGVGAPDVMLSVGSASHAVQTARVMERIEPVMTELEPDLVLVPGDVNSTLAAALVASKLGIAIGHIEAGLRSFDRTMPEEINRVLTDQISDILFIHSPEARDNLRAEGVPPDRVHAVGNTMIDSLVAMRTRIGDMHAAQRRGLRAGSYLVVTLHRPALVDGPLLAEAMTALDEVAAQMTVLFPIHPRTDASMKRQGLSFTSPGMRLLEPLGYVEFLSLVQDAAGVLTDSGGMQEETTYLGIPCFTLRDNTERPVTCTLGTNALLGLEPGRISEIPSLLTAMRDVERLVPPLWDGEAAVRIVDMLEERDDYRGHFVRGFPEGEATPTTVIGGS